MSVVDWERVFAQAGRETTTSLLAVFLTLKMTGLIEWPWWGVLMPLWLPLAFSAVAGGFYLGIVKREARRKRGE